jgi:hypothetical protein
MTKTVHKLWQLYPGSRLHCDITPTGLDTYRVALSLIVGDDHVVGNIEHYGGGNLNELKDAALDRLFHKLTSVTEHHG